ncbi:thioredoxin family protein [Rhodoferax aquaticus]|nr:thioredoxin family protein [Rhodoferax aquaticus]
MRPTSDAPATPPKLLVACLCAAWCGACREYQPLFAQLAAEFPQVQFRWVDIEDESDAVDPVEVENFPTLLLAYPGEARFFGTVTPHLDTLRRLVQLHSAAYAERPVTQLAMDARALAERLHPATPCGKK